MAIKATEQAIEESQETHPDLSLFTHNTDLDRMTNDLETAARIVQAPFNRELTSRLLHLFEGFYAHTPIAFRTTTKAERSLDVRAVNLMQPADPYPVAVAEGCIREVGHPLEKAYQHFIAKFPIMAIGLDINTGSGLSKIWTFVPPMTRPLEELYDLPFFPKAIREQAKVLTRYGLSKWGAIGWNFQKKALNVYFTLDDPCHVPLDTVRGLISDLHLTMPDDEIVEYCCGAQTIYPTFTWESKRAHRLSFAAPAVGSRTVPTHWHPVIKRFYDEAPIAAERRGFVCNPAPSRDGVYTKIESDYTGSFVPLMMMKV